MKKLLGWCQWVWWAITCRCLTCGALRRTDTKSYGCYVHHGVWKRCVSCEAWHLDNEKCPPVAPWPMAEGPWSKAIDEARRRGLS